MVKFHDHYEYSLCSTSIQVTPAEGWNPLNFFMMQDAQCDEETVRNIELGHIDPLFQAIGTRSEYTAWNEAIIYSLPIV